MAPRIDLVIVAIARGHRPKSMLIARWAGEPNNVLPCRRAFRQPDEFGCRIWPRLDCGEGEEPRKSRLTAGNTWDFLSIRRNDQSFLLRSTAVAVLPLTVSSRSIVKRPIRWFSRRGTRVISSIEVGRKTSAPRSTRGEKRRRSSLERFPCPSKPVTLGSVHPGDYR
jgi:hypothetical protein